MSEVMELGQRDGESPLRVPAGAVESEVWRSISGIRGYEASNLGRIRSFWVARSRYGKMSASPTIKKLVFYRVCTRGYRYSYGYLRFGVARNASPTGKRFIMSVHRAVLLAFGFSQPSDEHEVDHRDGVKTNNRLKNLRWVTHLVNMETRKSVLGECAWNAVFKESDVREIHSRKSCGESAESIALSLGFNLSTVKGVFYGHNWVRLNPTPPVGISLKFFGASA